MVYGVIMAGGKGTRLWPEGRSAKPKQLLSLTDERPMIRVAVERLSPLIPIERQLIVTTEDYAPQIADALPEFPPENILREPEGRDTAPCIGWSAVKIVERDPDAVMAVVTADHAISGEDRFREVLDAAISFASREDIIVTIGLTPTRPDTGLGYICVGDVHATSGGIDICHVDKFVEKPDIDTARRYLEEGNYLWNSGMFMMRASHALDLFRQHQPVHHSLLMKISESVGTDREENVTRECYSEFPKISIDYALMERAENVAVIRGDFGWLDIGTWAVLDRFREHDGSGNVVDGEHVGIDTEGCIIRSHQGIVATIGVRDLVIISTPDALLICPKDQAQRVREMVALLDESGRSQLT